MSTKRRKTKDMLSSSKEFDENKYAYSNLKYIKNTDPPHGYLLYQQLNSGDDLFIHDEFTAEYLSNITEDNPDFPSTYKDTKRSKKMGVSGKAHKESIGKYTFPNYNQFAQMGGADGIISPQEGKANPDELNVGIEVQWPLANKNILNYLNKSNVNGLVDLEENDGSLELWYRLPKSAYSRKVGLSPILPERGSQIMIMLTDTQKILSANVIDIKNNYKRPSTGSIIISDVEMIDMSSKDPSVFLKSIKSKKRIGNPQVDAVF